MCRYLPLLVIGLILYQPFWGIEVKGLNEEESISKVLNPTTNHEYALIDERMNWWEAQQFCVNQGGHLVTIINAAENEFISAFANQIGETILIGLTDEQTEGEFHWITGEPVTYTNWAGSEPNDYGDGEDYTEIQVEGTWNDVPTDYEIYFVCEWSNTPYDVPDILIRILLFLFFVKLGQLSNLRPSSLKIILLF